MPWARGVLRGQRVLARVGADGTLGANGGRVEVRYRQNDGRAYQAAARNLEIVAGEPLLPDDACGPAEAAPTKDERAPRAAGKKAEAAAKATAPGAVPRDAFTVYAAGACSGNPGPAGLGIVIVAPDGKMH